MQNPSPLVNLQAVNASTYSTQTFVTKRLRHTPYFISGAVSALMLCRLSILYYKGCHLSVFGLRNATLILKSKPLPAASSSQASTHFCVHFERLQQLKTRSISFCHARITELAR